MKKEKNGTLQQTTETTALYLLHSVRLCQASSYAAKRNIPLQHDLTHTQTPTRLTALFQDNPGKPVPER